VATRHSHIRLLGRRYVEVPGGEQQQAEMIFVVSDGKDDDGLSGESEEKKELVGLGTSVEVIAGSLGVSTRQISIRSWGA
jgi:hypothetical protein